MPSQILFAVTGMVHHTLRLCPLPHWLRLCVCRGRAGRRRPQSYLWRARRAGRRSARLWDVSTVKHRPAAHCAGALRRPNVRRRRDATHRDARETQLTLANVSKCKNSHRRRARHAGLCQRPELPRPAAWRRHRRSARCDTRSTQTAGGPRSLTLRRRP